MEQEKRKTGIEVAKPTDRLLPVANVSNIMKRPIPRSAKISKDAKELMQRAASEFIAFVTCKAQDLCQMEKRKTLTGEDLINSMEQLGMPYHAEAGRKYLQRVKEGIKIERMKESWFDKDDDHN
jgi:nuclear transcription Y subunit beta